MRKPCFLFSILSVLSYFYFANTALSADPKLLRWGTDPTGGAPFVYQDNDGKFIGFEVDFAQYLADKIGRKSVMKPGDWDKLPQRLDQKVDLEDSIDIVLNGYELQEELSKQYAVSRPYYIYRLQLMAHKTDESIQGWSDLPARDGKKGKSVGVLNATVAHKYTKDLFGDKIDLKINPDVATVIGLVKDRRMDATVQDSPAAIYFLKTTPDLKKVDEPRLPGYYVIYLRKTDPELLEQLNKAIRDGIQDGTLKKIYEKYDLWNEDQERLLYWADSTRTWPPEEQTIATQEQGEVKKESPWKRMIVELLQAAGMTIFLSVTSFPLAMALGMLVAIGRVYGPRWFGFLLSVYVEILRGTPLLLQLYTIYYLLPKMMGFDLTPLQAGIFGLAINYSACESENYRAGLLAIPRGQLEAALSLGMSPFTAILKIVAPQAFRLVIPPVTNDFIAMFKDTSVCSVILIVELTRKYNELYNFNREYIVELAFITAGLYLLMSYPLAIAARMMERRLASAREGGRS